ncbi:cytochrome c biogenesis protein CcsA [Flavobacterium urocaniciphilum]|uniref:Cytochrome c-type biogenesis protein CcsB n=1 Tax=Flavobacterium urocaniciphilum TaxID=1299341 RepID=A0A1H9B5Q2_9FLAO|nr:cytochrome c biogenesis protein CcsA [Flavobacterium urocaniciphilum]SEP84360.1 cytochrome c-type biogenesis protein CcsB [Flavobacterium urocaniciphilum]
MLQKILSGLYSTRLMAILFIGFAGAMAAGTFIEDAYNTETARIIIYNTWWFEAIMFLFVINFFGNIKRYQLYKKEKWATLLLHLSFIFIIIGAFVTRYISYEGLMPIREGESSNIFYSDMPHFTALVDGEYNGEMSRKRIEKQMLLSQATNNSFNYSDKFNETPFEIELQQFIMNASNTFVPSKNGDLYIKLVEASAGSRKEHYLKEGELKNINNILFAFNKFTQGAVNISKISEAYTIQMPFDGNFMRMADKFQGTVSKDQASPLMFRSLYNAGGSQFVFPELAQKGEIVLKSNNDYKDKKTDDAIVVKVTSQGKEEIVTLLGSKGKQGEPKSFKLGKLDFTLMYGSKVHELPFSIKLEDFIADKFPGTEKSYSAYKSKLEIQDKQKSKTFKDSVFMNNILDYREYRFFQASFDPDEKGTVLSVNHDFWGTWITYIGYFLLYFGLMAILFDKNTRFNDLKKKLDKIRAKKQALTALLFFFGLFGFAQDNHAGHNHDAHSERIEKPAMPTAEQSLKQIKKFVVSKEHAEQFGRLVIQDISGRMKPVNTFSSELLRKVSKNDTFEGMTSDQVLISMNHFPEFWYQIPIIYLKRGNDSIRKIIGVDKDVKYAPLISFFDEFGNYKLTKQAEDAYKEAIPNQFQKDFIDADKKVNLLYSAISGQILKVFPIPNDKNNKWASYLELSHATNTNLDTVKNIIPFYFSEAGKATQSKNYKNAESLLKGLSNYQKKFGGKVMLSEDKINTEILYNKYDIFKKLFSWYMYAGVLMFVFVIVKIFSDKKWVNVAIKVFHGIIILLFLLHLVGLIARWYISGHAPWSDAYESMIYVGWATMFFGLAFGRKSELTVASTTFVASIILMVAHWNWMDPSIANLQPVLNSYWLMIHVAVIVASYGPFTLGMILGLVALFLMIFTNKNNKKKIELSIKEITYINEMALTVGLVMLTIGNFLGGQWANESWGRYWGWDPKETWALISIMVYAFVIHARFVPALRGLFAYNFMSVLAFASILMTYFGVNFHLSGLHSYASGEEQNVVYYAYALAIVLAISAIAYFQFKRFYKK